MSKDEVRDTCCRLTVHTMPGKGLASLKKKRKNDARHNFCRALANRGVTEIQAVVRETALNCAQLGT